ncbi:alkaline phosphatase family protein, partial [Bordetella pertussis]
DPHRAPTPDGDVFVQAHAGQRLAPYPLAPALPPGQPLGHLTPHTWDDAQRAWNDGRMDQWLAAKGRLGMGYYRPEELPLQTALARAFTLCEAYHCSMHAGTNPNRLFLWTGTNDPHGQAGGPALVNTHDRPGPAHEGYAWTTYPERLQAAGVDWAIYQDMADNYHDNPLAGFRQYRAELAGGAARAPLRERALSTRTLAALAEDAANGRLPQVAWIIAPAADSEHPEVSSPAQGAAFSARVLDILTRAPALWRRCALLLTYDENDCFFDHMPPPAPPGAAGGGSTADTAGEYHQARGGPSAGTPDDPRALHGRAYGLGPRVPMLVVSPFSRGGWLDARVYDHTSVIRLLESRFGVAEPNISPWRRAVCGDLSHAFDFTGAQDQAGAPGPRSRPSPYACHVEAWAADGRQRVRMANPGHATLVLHVYDCLRLAQGPRRYTIEPGRQWEDSWPDAGADLACDLWILGPDGFHRHIRRHGAAAPLAAAWRDQPPALLLENRGAQALQARIESAYGEAPALLRLAPGEQAAWPYEPASRGWYDLTASAAGQSLRLAGRMRAAGPGRPDPRLG